MKGFTAAVAVAVAATAVVIASLAGVFSSKPAYATPGVNFNSTVVARGSLGSDLLFGTPTQTVVTRSVSFKSKGRTFRKAVKVTVPLAGWVTATTVSGSWFGSTSFCRTSSVTAVFVGV